MRYLEVSLQRPPNERHPMHQLIVEHEDYDASRLLYQHQYAADENAVLFHVDGPRSPYEEALEDVPSTLEFEIAPCQEDTFYLYARGAVTKSGRIFIDAVSQPGLIAVPPVEYQSDGTIRLTTIGPSDAIQAAVENISDLMTVDVVSIGEFRAGRIDSRAALTQRQFEAVSAAVDCGYYRMPREGSLEEIAARLECSSGTAGELLRRAERTVMTRLVE
ncbi:helix-turn-helix domain-containing protein [Halostagnicola sp. A-GB9-2]|uniref:helix-turn-helix domain-containing protein n=1 Tax=Halostagnicola sp. A-GB9-2 TaxID=3048066 RepID=UPI0024C024DB|nr:helix-turn-helix domain-containing protein [Halostagnicola sp. A-GB9-2]MDJ1430738.1 helix-turn-helix domain-containing protein [Halostagnicola sp. A-GB9-2]